MLSASESLSVFSTACVILSPCEASAFVKVDERPSAFGMQDASAMPSVSAKQNASARPNASLKRSASEVQNASVKQSASEAQNASAMKSASKSNVSVILILFGTQIASWMGNASKETPSIA